MEKVKRPLLFTGLIMDIVSLSLLFLGFIMILNVEEVMENHTIVTIIYVLIGITVVGILFSALGLMVCGKIYYLYRSKRFFIVTVFVILCVFIFFGIIGILNIGVDTGLELVILLVMAVGATFTMIGHVNANQNNDTDYIRKYQDTFNKEANDKLAKLVKLKELNVITDEEFEAMKQKYLDNLKR